MPNSPEKEDLLDLKVKDPSTIDPTHLKEVGEEIVEEIDEGPNGLPADTEKLPKISEQFEVIELLGKGGMGSVYKVTDKKLGKILAVKILQKDLTRDQAALKRFEQETESASKLSHPNLVSVYSHGKTDDDCPYLVMEYIEGKSLAKTIEEEEKLNPERVLNIFINICQALEHAHKNGVIHRDIKPTNIILTKDKTGIESAAIVDFGIAKVMDSTTRETHDLTQTGEVFGSPHYMSPEQCLGFMLKEESDIYSLGCSLYESLTGAPPFAGSNPIQLVVKHINDDVDSFPKEFKKDSFRKQLEKVTLKCLEKEMADRYDSVSRLREDLERIKAGKPIPNYVLKGKTKPTLTKRQSLAGVALIIGIFTMTLTVANPILGSEISNKLGSGFAAIILGTAFIALTSMGFEKLKEVRAEKRDALSWWTMIIMISAGFSGLTVLPSLIKLAVYSYYSNQPLWVTQIVAASNIANVFFMIILTASCLGWLAFRRKTNVSGLYILTRQMFLILAVVAVPIFVVPEKAKDLPSHLADTTREAFPAFSIASLQLERLISSDKTASARKLANLLQKQNRSDEAYNVLRDAVTTAKDDSARKALYSDLADLYREDKKFANAIECLNQAIKNSYDKASGTYEDRFFKDKAKNFLELKNYDSALSSINKYIASYPEDDDAYITKALIYAAESKYDKSMEVLDWATKNYSYDAKKRLIRGIINEHLGNTAEAQKDFKRVLEGERWITDNIDKYKSSDNKALFCAYANHRMGHLDMAQKILSIIGSTEDPLTKSDLPKRTGLDQTDIPLKW